MKLISLLPILCFLACSAENQSIFQANNCFLNQIDQDLKPKVTEMLPKEGVSDGGFTIERSGYDFTADYEVNYYYKESSIVLLKLIFFLEEKVRILLADLGVVNQKLGRNMSFPQQIIH